MPVRRQRHWTSSSDQKIDLFPLPPETPSSEPKPSPMEIGIAALFVILILGALISNNVLSLIFITSIAFVWGGISSYRRQKQASSSNKASSQHTQQVRYVHQSQGSQEPSNLSMTPKSTRNAISTSQIDKRVPLKCPDCSHLLALGENFCANCGEAISWCKVCHRVIRLDDTALKCPHCTNQFHREHIKEWLRVSGKCPVCQQPIAEGILIVASMSTRKSKRDVFSLET